MSSFNRSNLKQNNSLKPFNKIDYYKMNTNIPKNIHFHLNISICIHCYDLKIFYELMFYIKNFFEFKWKRIQIIIHYVNQELKLIENIIENVFKDDITTDICNSFIFIKGENIGVDIGGFMRCLDYVNDDDDYIIKIHTKSDEIWRKKMMNIFTKEGIYTSIKLLENKGIGMIGSAYNIEFFRKKFNPQFNINKFYIPKIQYMCNSIEFPFNANNLINSHFVAGTIFICKKELLQPIINHKSFLYSLCLDFRKEIWKTGKMSQTYEHAMEIMFGYIPFQLKHKLVGIY
jgi:hypothetical protein